MQAYYIRRQGEINIDAHCCEAMDKLVARYGALQKNLAKKHLCNGILFLYNHITLLVCIYAAAWTGSRTSAYKFRVMSASLVIPNTRNDIMRRLFFVLLLLMAILLPQYKVNGETPIKIILDGKVLNLDTAPEIKNNRTLVPLRGIFEALGASVNWNAQTRQITAKKDGRVVSLTIADDTAYKNIYSVKLDAPAYIKDNRTMVPLRFIAESFGADVGWDGSSRTVSIKSFIPNEFLRNANVIVYDNYVIGAWRDGWVDADKVFMALSGNEKFRVYEKQKFLGEKAIPKGDSFEKAYGPWAEQMKLANQYAVPALATTKSVTFGKFIEQDITTPVYIDYVKEILTGNGLYGENVYINQIVRTDIDADGVDEVFVSASNVFGQNRPALKGQYSFLVMRKLVNGKLQSFFIYKSFKPGIYDNSRLLYWYTLNEAADFNGDGKLEFIVNERYYEGTFYILAHIRPDGTLDKILSNGIGV